ncbi:MAG: 50S ribosomal protein L17 [Bacteroidota bacterium]
MRHNKTINQLGRTTSHRKAMLANMASSLILHKRIATTVAKAKVLRGYVEPLITKSKEDSTHSRRTVFSYLGNKEAVTELFRDISKKIADRPGGYTRILKTGARLGDNAEMCIIELVDYNQIMLGEKEAKAAKSGTRRRRSSGTKKTTENVAVAKEEKKTVAPKAKKTTELEAKIKPEPEVAVEPEVVEEPEKGEDKVTDKEE